MENYKILKEIGVGSFGHVYLAQRFDTGLIVALKKVHKFGRSEKETRDLRQECEVHKNFNHPNIIKMLDSFESRHYLIIVTEYAAHGDLSKLLSDALNTNTGGGGKYGLDIPHVQKIASDLLSALYYIHGQRVLHRDLKPQNVLIGSDGLYKLCDFGFAKNMGIGTYVLTSVKGTPLYMAPEVIEEKSYDHKAEFWSLGCILFELLTGRPPYFTNQIHKLVAMVRTQNIFLPDFLSGDCRSFLQGLLEKNSRRRYEWDDIIQHPFVREELQLRLQNTGGEPLDPLTKALTPSQEIEKENQRQNLQRKMDDYSKLLMRTARKYEEAQRRLHKCGFVNIGQQLPYQACGPMAIPNSNIPIVPEQGDPIKPTQKNKFNTEKATTPEKITTLTNSLPNLNVNAVDDNISGNMSDEESGSSCETLTSTSGDESSEDRHTVIIQDENVSSKRIVSVEAEPASGSGPLWFSDHNTNSKNGQNHIQTEEWIHFVSKTLKEVMDNPKSLCEKHFLAVIVTPLRNHSTGAEVTEKIVNLLCLPFALGSDLPDGLFAALQSTYLDSKVLPNVLYSCKLIVRQRLESTQEENLDKLPMIMEEILEMLTPEDISALTKCLRLVCFLVYLDDDFVVQLCASVCLLKSLPILQLLLKLDKNNVALVTDTLAILCQLMRIIPSNVSIVEQVLWGDFNGLGPKSEDLENFDTFWHLLNHHNTTVKSRSVRILSYLAINSVKTRDNFIQKNLIKLYKLLRECLASEEVEIREAASYAVQNIKYLSHLSVSVDYEPVRIESLGSVPE